MKEKHAQRWRETRHQGMRTWVIRKGILGWGVPMCVVFVGMQGARHPAQLPHILLLNLPIWFVAGLFFGSATWFAMEWQYKRHLRKAGRQE